MSDIQDELVSVLGQAAGRLRETGLPGYLSAQMEQLAEQVHQPCVVAVVGRVKAGKSTFINALLGQDLAKVGTTETTATINYFRYGQAKPDRPIRCYWRGRHVTEVDRAFLDNLQGNDVETLRRADGIDHLEYHLLNRYLERVTLVDTPGTGAAVEEHQNTLAEFMRLCGQLRERHDRDTQRLASDADAVLYLIGETAGTADRDFLEEFRQVTQGRARSFNAIGVMAKIEKPQAVYRLESEVEQAKAGREPD
jgi:predicted GTPase